jgi:hypothetical protein
LQLTTHRVVHSIAGTKTPTRFSHKLARAGFAHG